MSPILQSCGMPGMWLTCNCLLLCKYREVTSSHVNVSQYYRFRDEKDLQRPSNIRVNKLLVPSNIYTVLSLFIITRASGKRVFCCVQEDGRFIPSMPVQTPNVFSLHRNWYKCPLAVFEIILLGFWVKVHGRLKNRLLWGLLGNLTTTDKTVSWKRKCTEFLILD